MSSQSSTGLQADAIQPPARRRHMKVADLPADAKKPSLRVTSAPEVGVGKSSSKVTARDVEKGRISAALGGAMSSLGYTSYIPLSSAEGTTLPEARRPFEELVTGKSTKWLKLRYPGERDSWLSMKNRVWRSKGRYTLHDDFRKFLDFLAHMGRKGEANRTLDRRDPNDLEYAPGKVRWATKREQANNRTNTIWLRGSDGRNLPLTEWAKITGQRPNTMRARHRRGGWREEEIVAGKRLPKASATVVPDSHTGAIQAAATAVQEHEGMLHTRCPGQPDHGFAEGLQGNAAQTSGLPASEIDVWVAAWRETYPGARVGVFGKRQSEQLAGARCEYESVSNGDWLEFFNWSVREWRFVIATEFAWMNSPPKLPDIGFLGHPRWLVKFVGCYAMRCDHEAVQRLEGDEAVYEMARALGKTHTQAAEEAAAHTAREKALAEAAAELKRLRQVIQAHESNLRQREMERAHMERARQGSVAAMQPRPFMKAERSTQELLAIMQATIDPEHRAVPAVEQAPAEAPQPIRTVIDFDAARRQRSAA